MTITSFVEWEHGANGFVAWSHSGGRAVGLQKRADQALEDGVYTMAIAGIQHDNPTVTDQTTPPTTLADGSTMNTEVRQGQIGIEHGPAGGDGNGALLLQTDSNNGRVRLNDGYSSDQFLTLGDLDQLSFDYYIVSSDRTDVVPVIRLAIDADGNLATTGDRGELIFEYVWQGQGQTTQGSWQTADLVGDDWTAWQRSFGVNRDQIVNMTELSDWADASGFTPAGGVHFADYSLVLGWSIALGSNQGTSTIYLDNLQVGGVTYDFFV